jgi:hypothetical protein
MASNVQSSVFLPSTASAPASAGRKPGLWRRILDAMIESRRRQVDREIARYVERSGVAFTDTVEREIERRWR